ncbi:MAG: nitroreductase family protein [bacterium]
MGFLKALIRLVKGKPSLPRNRRSDPFLQIIFGRRSIRSFREEDISDEELHIILEAGRFAPSTVNMQTWAFFPFDRREWQETFGNSIPFGGARAIIVCGDVHRIRRTIDGMPESPLLDYTVGVLNASLAAMNMTLAAEALGLGSIILSETGRTGFFDALYLKDKLCLPDGVFPICTLVVGYIKSKAKGIPPRIPLDQVALKGRYREADPSAMEEWYEQMKVGYRLGNPTSSLEGRLKYYAKNFPRVELELRQLVWGEVSNAMK